MTSDAFAVWLEGFFDLARPTSIDGEALAELCERCRQAAADVRDRMAFDAMVKRERVTQEVAPFRPILGTTDTMPGIVSSIAPFDTSGTIEGG